ncbi:MAG: VWA domain-containing protein [Rhizobiales bacterium]|nr:VWA domain-containing protein [Hyphomicrobiales bacterium]
MSKDRSKPQPSSAVVSTGEGKDVSPTSDVDAFLAKVNTMPPATRAGEVGRLIFAMDATMSRQPTWDSALQIQGEMFEETAKIGGLDVQLIFFRGFGECKASKWVSDGRSLAHLMSTVSCRGGQTQIGKVLSRILKENAKHKVNAVVYVGDAMEEDVDLLCNQAGEIGLLGVPLFMFQEGYDVNAERAFREIARLTRGAWCRFDASSARQLRELLSAVAVYASGGRKALADYSKAKGGEAVALLEQLS